MSHLIVGQSAFRVVLSDGLLRRKLYRGAQRSDFVAKFEFILEAGFGEYGYVESP